MPHLSSFAKAIVGSALMFLPFTNWAQDKMYSNQNAQTISTESSATNTTSKQPSAWQHLTVHSTVKDVLQHPAFTGFSSYILPLDWGYNEDMELSHIASLLPYHNYINAQQSVDDINEMIDMIGDGTLTYHYLGRRNTGLFFFHGKANAPFAVICPGGGFSYVGSIHEGFPHAIAFSKMGYNAFVVQYRVGGAREACEDLALAIAYIFQHQKNLKVDLNGYSLWGSSAGARMAAYLGSYGTAYFRQKELPKPSAVIMAYTGHSEYTRQDPPTYSVIGTSDSIASPYVMKRRTEVLQKMGIPADIKIYQGLRHGFGLGRGTVAEGWINDAVRFWRKNSPNSQSDAQE